MKLYLLRLGLAGLGFGASAQAATDALRFRFVAAEPSLWVDARRQADVAREIDGLAAAGFNGVALGTYKFMPMYFVDYARTPYPEAQQYDAATVARNVATLRENIRRAKAKGIRYFVARSYSHYVGVNFWRAHQAELNPGGMFTRLLQEAHQNDIYFATLRGKDNIIPQQQWTNPTYRKFFLASTERMLDALPELDGFLNAYAEAAWTYDPQKIRTGAWKGWKDAVDTPATDRCFADYANTLYRMLVRKRGENAFFGLRDWYVSPQTLQSLDIPRDKLVIAVKYAGYDQPLVNFPPWGKALQDQGYSVMLDLHEFDAEHPHPIYWFHDGILAQTFAHIREAGFAGVQYQGYEGRGNERADPIRLLTNRAVGAAMTGRPMSAADAEAVLRKDYGDGAGPLLRSLKDVGFAQAELIKLCPAWFWQGDGLTPGGPQTLKFWMLRDNPDAPPGMAFVRQDVQGVENFVAGRPAAGMKTPEDVIREMTAAADDAVAAAREAARRAPSRAPYLKDIVASAFLHREMVKRDVAFLRAALAYYRTGGKYDGKYNEATDMPPGNEALKRECREQLAEMVRCDLALRALCVDFAPRRPRTRENFEYAFVRKVADITGQALAVTPEDVAALHLTSAVSDGLAGKENLQWDGGNARGRETLPPRPHASALGAPGSRESDDNVALVRAEIRRVSAEIRAAQSATSRGEDREAETAMPSRGNRAGGSATSARGQAPAAGARPLGTGSPVTGETGVRVLQTINRDWTFNYFPAPVPDLAPARPDYDDSRWKAVAVPHTWSTYETTRDVHPFIRSATEADDTYWWYGWGWYRKRVVLGSKLAGRRAFLEFDAVQKVAKIYVNGALAAEHKGGYTSFSVDITPYVRFGAENLIAVQVSNRRNTPADEIPPSTAGNFDVYGGIYRDVRLVLTDPLHVPFQGSSEHEGGTFVTTPRVSAAAAIVRVRTWVQNDSSEPRTATLVTTVRDAAGNAVLAATARATLAPGENHGFDQTLGSLPQPHLWSPDSPYLYRVTTEVREGDRLADTFFSPLGIRWFSWNHAEKRLHLNGAPILLRGTNRHQEFPWLGDAMPKWMHRQDLEDIRYNMGLNFQRTVHYPNDPFVYQECDRLGFMLIEEACAIKDIAFDRGVQQQIVKEMIRRDRNHPSILIWSMGNETNQPADSAWGAAEDPTRIIYLRRSENGGSQVQLTDKELAIENLLRCTVRGWLNEDDHDFGEETGHPAGSQVTGTEEWQYLKTIESPKLNDGNVVTWLYADHGCDRHYLGSPLLNINPKGWKDAYRFPKLAFYIWPANFTTQPMAFIHPTWWRPQYLGQRHEIRIDSNCDEVELKLDGKSLGRRRPTAANAHSVAFADVPVTRGVLTVEGRRQGEAVTATLAMAGAPARLVLTTRQSVIPADRAGIAVCALDIVDDRGVHVFGAHPRLTWTVEGPATLVGPPVYDTDTRKREALDGTMYIDAPVANLVRSTAVPGEIRVRVTAEGLPPAELTLHSIAPERIEAAGVTEPALDDAGREPVRRDPAFAAEQVKPRSTRIADIGQDVTFGTADPAKLRNLIGDFVREHNPELNPFSAPYRAFVERMTAIVAQRSGLMIADDYNFNAHALNQAGKPPKKKKKS